MSGKVLADEFIRLCENQHPVTGKTLTQRLNTTRIEDGEKAANRRIFYDFTFSPPKSVSLVALAGEEGRIVEAHNRAVRSALALARGNQPPLISNTDQGAQFRGQRNDGQPNRPSAPESHSLFSAASGSKMGTSLLNKMSGTANL